MTLWHCGGFCHKVNEILVHDLCLFLDALSALCFKLFAAVMVISCVLLILLCGVFLLGWILLLCLRSEHVWCGSKMAPVPKVPDK